MTSFEARLFMCRGLLRVFIITDWTMLGAAGWTWWTSLISSSMILLTMILLTMILLALGIGISTGGLFGVTPARVFTAVWITPGISGVGSCPSRELCLDGLEVQVGDRCSSSRVNIIKLSFNKGLIPVAKPYEKEIML